MVAAILFQVLTAIVIAAGQATNRRVDGVMLPFAMHISDGSPFDTSVRTFTTIKHNVDVDDATFQQPAPPPR
jgi:hypothetical protein